MKKLIIILITFCTIINHGYTQDSSNVAILKLEVIKQENVIDSLADLTEIKSAKIKKLEAAVLKTEESDKSTFEFLFPSIIALIVALVAYLATVSTGKKQRESSERILIKQIDSGKSNAELTFRQNVLSTNRQVWINNLRSIISKSISSIEFIAVNDNITPEDYRNISELLLEAELMVNPDKDKDFIDALNNLKKMLMHVLSKEKVMDDLVNCKKEVLLITKRTLKTEWERVKKGE